jgi:hypothetical protein
MICVVCKLYEVPDDDANGVCAACVRRIVSTPASTDIVPISQARNVALAKHIGRALTPMETFLVAQARGDADNPIETPIDEEGELQLAAAFEAFRGAPELPRAKDAVARKKIGEAIARYLLGARDSDSADQAARRVVAALGVEESLAVADTFVRWGQALAAWADKANERGHKR